MIRRCPRPIIQPVEAPMNARGNGPDEVFVLLFFSCVGIGLVISLIIHIFFFLTLSRCLSRIQPRNRDMEPGLVWLNFIPFLNMVWIFCTVNWISSSLRKEYQDRGWRTGGETFGNGVGIGFAS